MPTEVGGSMELSGNLAGFLFVLQEPYLENAIFWRRWIDGQAAESVDMRLRFPGAMLHGEIIFLHILPSVQAERLWTLVMDSDPYFGAVGESEDSGHKRRQSFFWAEANILVGPGVMAAD